MKRILSKWLLAFSLIMLIGHVNAQQRYYCEVKGIEQSFKSGLKIIFDFGTETSYNMWGDLSSKLKFVDEKGNEIDFNSMVDAANYMVKRGWVFQQAYSSSYGGSSVIHWIFFKDAETMEQAKEGILTKEEFQKMQKVKSKR